MVPLTELLHNGFRLDYYTHHFVNPQSGQYVFCYDYGYLTLADGRYLIVRSKGTVRHGVSPLFPR
jgi:hypothetical protein